MSCGCDTYRKERGRGFGRSIGASGGYEEALWFIVSKEGFLGRF